MDSAALNKQAIACAKHYMGKTAWPTMLLTAAVVAAFGSRRVGKRPRKLDAAAIIGRGICGFLLFGHLVPRQTRAPRKMVPRTRDQTWMTLAVSFFLVRATNPRRDLRSNQT